MASKERTLQAAVSAVVWLASASCAETALEDPSLNGIGTTDRGDVCPADTTLCGGACVSLATSATDCGSCGAACEAGTTCQGGQCVCQSALTLCGGECVDLQSDGANCGACGAACGGQVCSHGACTVSCGTETQCGMSCVDVDTDPLNCGGCGITCPPGQTCQARECRCPLGQDACDGACVDLATSPAHCGACGVACDAGVPCVAGACQPPIGSGGAAGTGGSSPGTGGSRPGSGGSNPGTGGSHPGSGGLSLGPGGTRPGAGGFSPGTGGSSLESGGVPPSSGGSSPGSGGSTSGRAFTIGEGAYVSVCGWHGFAWTGAGPEGVSTISPASFSDLKAGASLCATGSVGADPNYGGYAMIGINVGQSNTGEAEPPNAEITPTGTGLYVSLTNHASNSFRIQIQDAQGADSADHRWCAVYSAPGVIPWSDFNTKCWDRSGTGYAKQPINAILVMVPGHNQNATPFDFCVNEIAPDGDPSCPR